MPNGRSLERKGWSLGIGTTDACNLHCPHCYSQTRKASYLTLADIRRIVDLFDIAAVNLGTGENGLNREFVSIVDFLCEKGIRTSLTSNGYTIVQLDRARLSFFSDIDVSLDFPNETEHDLFRGQGAWRMALAGLEKCLAHGLETSVATCLMNVNHHRMADFIPLVHRYGVNLRLNVYKAVQHRRYVVSYEQFWTGLRAVLDRSRLVACSEGVVNAVMGLRGASCNCGLTSLRIRPNGDIVPCVYWDTVGINCRDLEVGSLDRISATFDKIGMYRIPQECIRAGCAYIEQCRGGCPARRFLDGGLNRPDEYCPFVRGDRFRLEPVMADDKNLVHAGYLCTIIVCT